MDNIILVDEKDNEIWLGEKMNVHKKWLLHRAISVLILNSKWEMLLQQRAFNKYHCGWMWSNTTCTHPFLNENNIDAAHRRLKEEMWFDTKLDEIFQFHYTAHFDNWLTENEIDHVFLWYYDWEINLNPDEANDYKRLSIEKLTEDIAINPQIYTQWFKIILEHYVSNQKI